MKDLQNREIMTRFYRLVEKYETPPQIMYVDEGQKYFTEVLKDCQGLYDEFHENEFAREFLLAFYSAIESRYKAANPRGLIDRPAEPEQTMMF